MLCSAMLKWANSAPQSLHTSKKILGVVAESKISFRVFSSFPLAAIANARLARSLHVFWLLCGQVLPYLCMRSVLIYHMSQALLDNTGSCPHAPHPSITHQLHLHDASIKRQH